MTVVVDPCAVLTLINMCHMQHARGRLASPRVALDLESHTRSRFVQYMYNQAVRVTYVRTSPYSVVWANLPKQLRLPASCVDDAVNVMHFQHFETPLKIQRSYKDLSPPYARAFAFSFAAVIH